MRYTAKRAALTVLVLAAAVTFTYSEQKPGPVPVAVPKVWDDAALASFLVPLVDAGRTPVLPAAEYYYRIPARPIYKNYPVYHPDREPPGYLEWLKQQEPEVAFDVGKLRAEADWVAAGELVYDTPVSFGRERMAEVRDAAWYRQGGVPLAKDGTVSFFRYVVRKKGEVELGSSSCAGCHTRVLPDGAVIKGAQGNFPHGRAGLGRPPAEARKDEKKFLERMRLGARREFGVPWLQPDPLARLDEMSVRRHRRGPWGGPARR